ncbi:MAG: TetR/AcrR family transcriptional regulator [Parvibaculaceae bacterium]|nr:TetR/AcrR family transcriptional regulator [Parvibaculaceae bacterium]
MKQAAKARAAKGKVETASPLGRRERNKQEKLDRILAAARELFAAKGFSDTTTQEIAERADIGTGTLFLYAKSKEDLLIMVFKDEMIETSQTALRKVSPDTPIADQLMQVFGAMVAYHNRDLPLARALIREITILANPDRREDVRSLMRIIYSGIGDIIASAHAREKIRPGLDLLLVGEALFGIYYVGLIGWLNGQVTKPTFLKRLRTKLALSIDGLRVPSAEPAAPARAASSRKS